MSIRTRRATKNDPLVISVTGLFDFNDYREFRRACRELPASKVVLVDLSRCTGLDSAAIGMLVNLCDRAEENGSEVRIVGCSGALRQHLASEDLKHILN